MTDKSIERLKSIAFLTSAFAMLLIGFWVVRNMIPIADEDLHYKQIMGIVEGRNYFPALCPYLPGYHWTMAGLVMLFHSAMGPTMRLLATLLSFLTVTSFYFLAKTVDAGTAVQKSLFFILFPLFFPFFPLIYTDVYSMMFIFVALYLALDRRFWLSGIASILGLLVRQNNIIWVLLIGLAGYLEACAPQERWKNAKEWIPKLSFYFLAMALTATFVIWNRGFVLGDRSHHEFSITCGNIFFLLFLFFFLFLPYHLSNFSKIVHFLRKHKMMWLVLAEVFLLYFFFFKADHPYNHMGRFFRNWLLWKMLESPLSKCLHFLPIGYAILSLCVTPLSRRSFYLLYPFTLLFLAPLPVIEIRYCFVPFALFILFKGPDSERITLFSLASYLVPIAVIIYSMKMEMFFP